MHYTVCLLIWLMIYICIAILLPQNSFPSQGSSSLFQSSSGLLAVKPSQCAKMQWKRQLTILENSSLDFSFEIIIQCMLHKKCQALTSAMKRDWLISGRMVARAAEDSGSHQSQIWGVLQKDWLCWRSHVVRGEKPSFSLGRLWKVCNSHKSEVQRRRKSSIVGSASAIRRRAVCCYNSILDFLAGIWCPSWYLRISFHTLQNLLSRPNDLSLPLINCSKQWFPSCTNCGQ